ncbi:MAG: hypothetical protein ACRCXC_10325 [Legionella sp.]
MYRDPRQLMGRLGRQGTPYNPTMFSTTERTESNVITTITINIKDGSLNLDKGSFAGDMAAAKEALQAFADGNEISFKSLGYGYGELMVNGEQHSINPYGIDVSMMLEFCNLDAVTLTTNAPTLK